MRPAGKSETLVGITLRAFADFLRAIASAHPEKQFPMPADGISELPLVKIYDLCDNTTNLESLMKTAKFLLAGLTGVSVVNLCFAQTWTQTSAPSNYWSSVASSADGTKLIASSMPNATPPPQSVIKGGVWISWDSGTTWQKTSLPVTKWDKVACSADGNIMFAVSDYYPPYNASFCASTNSGLTWTSNGISAFGGSLACSADGSKMAALLSQNPTNCIYTSSDFGEALVASILPNSGAYAITCSADGKNGLWWEPIHAFPPMPASVG